MAVWRSSAILLSEVRCPFCLGYGIGHEAVEAAILAAGPYAIANVRIDTYGVYTNNTPSGAFRSFGALQSQFATETHLDICAEKLGLDPFEMRRINAMRDGATTHTKQKLNSVSMLRALDAAERASRWEAGAPTARGPTRGDLGGDGVRPSCSLGSRFAASAGKARSEVS